MSATFASIGCTRTQNPTEQLDESAVIMKPQHLSDEQWRATLSAQEYKILREKGTEYPGTGRYLHNTDEGTYHCAGCGQALYNSDTKFDSGCGWPSFFEEVHPTAVLRQSDHSLGMSRTELICANCGGHLGHVFNDAPDQPTGQRHCLNGTALIFVPHGDDPEHTIKEHRELQASRKSDG